MRVMLAEDSTLLREGLALLLAEEGHTGGRGHRGARTYGGADGAW